MGLSRRRFLLGMGGLVGAGLVSACSASMQATATPAPAPVKPAGPAGGASLAPTSAAAAQASPAAAASSIPSPARAAPPPSASTIATKAVDMAIARGGEPEALTRAAIEALGGMGRFVQPGQRVVIKPNIGFPKRPEYAASTNPEVIATLVRMCREVGARSILVFDNPVVGGATAYKESGIEEAATKAGAEVVQMSRLKFKETDIPRGKVIKRWPIYEDALGADVLINVPILKNHDVSTLTLGMKNLMGVVGGNRGNLHQNIGQTLADLGTAISVHLTVLDAVRVLLRNGPSGGNLRDVEKRDIVVASADRVAVDSYACGIVGKAVTEVPYIPASVEMGLGKADYRFLTIKEVQL